MTNNCYADKHSKRFKVGISDVYLASLEQRLALDAAGAVEAIDGIMACDVEQESLVPPMAGPLNTASDLARMLSEDAAIRNIGETRLQVVFVDASIDNFDDFIASLPSDIEAHTISSDRDGVSQIASALAGRSDLEAIHIVSHGDAGALILGDALVTAETIQGRYADDFAAIGASLTDGADFLIYGCDFASGTQGEAAANLLATVTGADVAASIDVTGSEVFGGNWVLEHATGAIEADALQIDNWEGALDNRVIEFSRDIGYNFSAGDFDAGRGGITLAVTIVALPHDGTLTLNGDAVGEGQRVAAADLDALLYMPSAGGDIDVDHRLYYTIDDDIGPNPSPPMGIHFDPYADYTVPSTDYFVDTSYLPADLPIRTLMVGAIPAGRPVLFTDTGQALAAGASFTPAQVDAGEIVVRYYSGEPGEAIDGLILETQRNVDVEHFTSGSNTKFTDDRLSSGSRLTIADGSRLLADGIYAQASPNWNRRSFDVPVDAAYFETLITGLTGENASVQVVIYGDGANVARTLLHNQTISRAPMSQVKLDVSGYDTLELAYRTGNNKDNYFGVEKPMFTSASTQIVAQAERVASIDTRLLQDPPAGETWDSFELAVLPQSGTLQLNGADLVAGTSYQMSDFDRLLFVPNAATALGRDLDLFSFTLTASDSSTAREVVSVSIVTNQPTAPSSTDISALIEDGTSHSFYAADFAFVAVDGASVEKLVVDVLPGAGTLTLDGVTVTVGQEIAVADVDNLIFTAGFSAYGTPYNSFDFRVRDSKDTLSSTYSVAVDVYSRPKATITNLSIAGKVAHQFDASDFGYSDADGDAMASVTIVALPSVGTLRLNGVAVTAGQEILTGNIAGLIYDFPPEASGDGYASYSYRLSDDDGRISDVATVAIDIAEAPTAADNTIETLEDTDHAFSVSDFGFSDANADSTFAAVIIDSLPTSGSLVLNGVDVTASQEIAVADIANLTYSPPANAFGTGLASFGFSVKDSSGLVSEASNAITIDVTSVQDTPSSADNTVSTAEDTDLSFSQSDFGFGDVDTDSTFAAVIIDSLPTSGSLVLNGVDVTTGQEIAVADIANMTYSPPANSFGTGLASFDFSVKDSTGLVSDVSNTITIDVTSVQDAPEGADNTVSTAEDTDLPFSQSNFGFSDIDTNSNFAAVIIDSLPTSGSLVLNGVDVTASQEIAVADIANLVYSPPANSFGTGLASFTFSVKDSAGLVSDASNTITIDVTSVQDAPSSADNTVSTAEDTDLPFSQSNFGFSDIDTDSTFAAVIIDSLPTSGSLVLNGVDVTTGQEIAVADISMLTYSPPTDSFGANLASFGFSVKDSTGLVSEASNAITIDVTSVQDTPSSADNTVSTAEDTDLPFSHSDFGFGDVDTDSNFAAVIIDSLPTSGSLVLNGVDVTASQEIAVADIANLVYSPPANSFGTGLASFTFSVKDNTGLVSEASNSITIDVTSVQDTPSSADNTVSTAEDTDLSFSQSDFGFGDVDTDSTFAAVIIDSLPTSGTLALNGAAVTAGQEIAMADISMLIYSPPTDSFGANLASFGFSVKDSSGLVSEASNTITIDVTSVNDAPEGQDQHLGQEENTNFTFSALNFPSSDVEGHEVVSIVVNGIPASGELSLNGVPVTAGQEIAMSQIDQLSYRAASYVEGLTDSFSYRMRDNGGTDNGAVDLSSTHRMNIALEQDIDLSVRLAIGESTAVDLMTDLGLAAADLITRSTNPATAQLITTYIDGAGQRVPLVDAASLTADQATNLLVSTDERAMPGEHILEFVVERVDGSRIHVAMAIDIVGAKASLPVAAENSRQANVVFSKLYGLPVMDQAIVPLTLRDVDFVKVSSVVGGGGAISIGGAVDTGSIADGGRNSDNLDQNLIIETFSSGNQLYISVQDALFGFSEGGLEFRLADGSALPEWIEIASDGLLKVLPGAPGARIELMISRSINLEQGATISLDPATGHIEILSNSLGG